MKTKYAPTRSDLIHRGFNPRAERHFIKWLKEIKPVNRDCKFIVYREDAKSFGYGRLRFNISTEEDLDTLIKLLSKGK